MQPNFYHLIKSYSTLRYYLFIPSIFLGVSAFGQTPIDSIISLKFPGVVKTWKLVDSTTAVNAQLKTVYFNSESESYIVFKTTLLKNNQEATDLPENVAALADIYHHLIASQISPMKKKGYVFKDSTRINMKGYIAYRLRYVNSKSNIQNAESLLLFLNGIRYVITYAEITAYSEKNRSDFLNSLQISQSKSIKQMQDQDPSSSSFSYILTAAIVLGFLMFFIRASKKQSQFGMNFKRVYCPVCGTKQPIIRMPGNINQAMVGGTTCPKCHANLDK